MSELIIKNFDIAAKEPAMLQVAIQSASRWPSATFITLWPTERGTTTGAPAAYCEWLLSIDSPGLPMGFYVGIIQRTPDSDVETHS